MNIRYPFSYTDAKDVLDDILASDRIGVKKYGSKLTNICDVKHYSIKAVDSNDNLENYSNLDLTISYMEKVMVKGTGFTVIPRTRELRLLTTTGDMSWSTEMVTKIWGGEYPSTVAVDKELGTVYLINLNGAALELVHFGIMDSDCLGVFLKDCFERQPFSIGIDNKALFDYISNLEGTNHLKKNIYIEFFSSVASIKVHCKEMSDI